jgi:hypothetical protein
VSAVAAATPNAAGGKRRGWRKISGDPYSPLQILGDIHLHLTSNPLVQPASASAHVLMIFFLYAVTYCQCISDDTASDAPTRFSLVGANFIYFYYLYLYLVIRMLL